jgi:hypothetical protein
MGAAETLGKQSIQRPPQYFLGAPLKHLFRRLIEQHDLVGFVDGNDRVHR